MLAKLDFHTPGKAEILENCCLNFKEANPRGRASREKHLQSSYTRIDKQLRYGRKGNISGGKQGQVGTVILHHVKYPGQILGTP